MMLMLDTVELILFFVSSINSVILHANIYVIIITMLFPRYYCYYYSALLDIISRRLLLLY